MSDQRTGDTHQTIVSAILREIARKGDASRFVKADRGEFSAKRKNHLQTLSLSIIPYSFAVRELRALMLRLLRTGIAVSWQVWKTSW